jgi:hypothetical protein
MQNKCQKKFRVVFFVKVDTKDPHAWQVFGRVDTKDDERGFLTICLTDLLKSMNGNRIPLKEQLRIQNL